MASKSLTSTELANLIAMLSEDGAAPIPRMSGFGPGARSGATQAQLLARLRQDLGADLMGASRFGGSASNDALDGLEKQLRQARAKAAGRGATASRLAAEQAKAGGGILGKGKGFMKGGLGKTLLGIGGGIAGTFAVMELMQGIREQFQDPSMMNARANAPDQFLANLQTARRPRSRDRLDISSDMRRLAAESDMRGIPMSRELQEILATDPNEIYKFRQGMRSPSIREAYAKAGIIT